MRTLYLVYLDREHLGDKLFMQGLAQNVSSAPSGEPPCVLLHGSGEKVERTLEAEGYFPERTRGVLDVDDPEHLALVERAVREVNQEVVGLLTDEVVSTVGIQGDSRSLLQRDEDGELVVGKVGWIEALIKQRVLPVVSALAEDATAGRVREIWTADALTAFADAFADTFDVTAVFFTSTDRPGLPAPEDADADRLDTASLPDVDDALPDHVFEPDALRHVARAGIDALLTTPRAFFTADEPKGTRVTRDG
jgi:acetylglutamate kinase